MRNKVITVAAMILSILLLPVSIFASSSAPSSGTSAKLHYVTDSAGILTEEEDTSLEAQAEKTSEQYGVGVYIITVDNYEDSGYEGAYEAASGMYQVYTLGEGSERNGILLFLSMDNRKWAMFCYGKKAQYAFHSYGQEQLEDTFLDNFRENDWYGGFGNYISSCDQYLEKAEAGHPVRKSAGPYLLLVLAIALITAAVVVAVMVSMMKNVRIKSSADAYTTGGLKLTVKQDRFLRTDVIRTKIKRDPPPDAGGGHMESGGGGTGRSGSF